MTDTNIKTLEQVEKETIQQQVNNNNTPMRQEDVAATVFHKYIEPFKDMVSKLSSKQLRRVIKYLVEYPIEEQKIRLPSNEEKATFYFGEQLLMAKMIMMYHTAEEVRRESVRKELEQKEAVVSPETYGKLKLAEEAYAKAVQDFENESKQNLTERKENNVETVHE